MKPSVRSGFPRDEPITRIDNLRDNWWCSTSPQHPYWFDGKGAAAAPLPRPEFVTEAEAGKAAAERLAAAGHQVYGLSVDAVRVPGSGDGRLQVGHPGVVLLAQQHFAQADDQVDRGAQLVADH